MGDGGDRDGYRDEIVGPKYQVRLGDLKPWHVLKISCWKCRHWSRLSPEEIRRCRTTSLLRRYRGMNESSARESVNLSRLIDLESRFRCTRCDNREGNDWKVQRMPR